MSDEVKKTRGRPKGSTNKVKRMPSVNNAGHTRKALSAKDIKESDKYYFSSSVVQRMLGKKYEQFVEEFAVKREEMKAFGGLHEPNPKHVKLLTAYQKGETNIDKLMSGLDCKDRTSLYSKVGRMLVYETETKKS